MASLYERLKRAQGIEQPKRAVPLEGLLVEQSRVSLREIEGSHQVDSKLIQVLSNQAIKGEFTPGQLLFFDTETTGLSRGAGTLAFLVGYGYLEADDLVVEQVLMRDYPQESLLLEDLLRRFNQSACLVSYNGAAFDIPLMQSRLTINRHRVDLAHWAHLDLLHAARRVYKLRLGRCPLTKLEEELFGFTRQDDLPGAEVPARYFAFLNTQDETLLRDIMDHNRQDIITLARLFFKMAALHDNPLESAHHQDIYSLGKAFERQGNRERAMVCYKACSDRTVRELARLRMAEIYRREGRNREAADLFDSMRAGGNVNPQVYISLAKIWEHRFRDPGRALEIARQGMLYCSQRYGENARNNNDFKDLERRCLRLMRKVSKLT